MNCRLLARVDSRIKAFHLVGTGLSITEETVRSIGSDPKNFDPNSTEIYGVGAFLLAGSEVYKLTGQVRFQ